VQAALDVGFDRIAMTAVAERLGTKHPTLYRYFATRDDLVTAAVDHVVRQFRWPTPVDDWTTYLRGHALATFQLLTEHRGLASQIMSLRTASPAYEAVSRDAVFALLDLGFAATNAILAYDLVHEQVLVFFVAGQRGGERARTPDEAAEIRRAALDQALPAIDPRLRDATVEIVQIPPLDWFVRKLNVILAGLAHLAP
jgi:TetR/AcrR family tetracycline transcriptional repressor